MRLNIFYDFWRSHGSNIFGIGWGCFVFPILAVIRAIQRQSNNWVIDVGVGGNNGFGGCVSIAL